MIKITKRLLDALDWKKGKEFEGDIYKSPDGRCELQYCRESNLCDETGFGWIALIDDSRHESLACCDVEYMEQVNALLEIYKDY